MGGVGGWGWGVGGKGSRSRVKRETVWQKTAVTTMFGQKGLFFTERPDFVDLCIVIRRKHQAGVEKFKSLGEGEAAEDAYESGRSSMSFTTKNAGKPSAKCGAKAKLIRIQDKEVG